MVADKSQPAAVSAISALARAMDATNTRGVMRLVARSVHQPTPAWSLRAVVNRLQCTFVMDRTDNSSRSCAVSNQHPTHTTTQGRSACHAVAGDAIAGT